jgi:hypothetical protein
MGWGQTGRLERTRYFRPVHATPPRRPPVRFASRDERAEPIAAGRLPEGPYSGSCSGTHADSISRRPKNEKESRSSGLSRPIETSQVIRSSGGPASAAITRRVGSRHLGILASAAADALGPVEHHAPPRASSDGLGPRGA